MVNWEISDIRDAIAAELEASTEYIDYRVEAREPEGRVWKVFLDLTGPDARGLDESLEGAAAWWGGPPKGGADVLSVIPEHQQINLRFATTPPPGHGQLLRVYPPRYLEALQQVWASDTWSRECLAWRDLALHSNEVTGPSPDYQVFQRTFSGRLRSRQVDAFKLPAWFAGFLWGPPGTGKTFTLGAVLAQYLLDFPAARILLFSTTNAAVDLAIVAVDRALEALERTSARAREVRRSCFRIGAHFRAEHYEGREHLLPVRDTRLIAELAVLEAVRPDPEQVGEYDEWKRQVEAVRQQIRQQAVGVLQQARLAAMTTTRAVFTFADVAAARPYELAVFDEASQVGLAHALALAPLAQHVLFAGDPMQLAPIVQSEDLSAQAWIGRSPFALTENQRDATCRLNEQGRMAPEICRVVSRVFYDGELVVASDCANSKQWGRQRELAPAGPLGTEPASIVNVTMEGVWSQKYGGPIRPESANLIADLVCELTVCLDEEQILVLTPFRAQRAFIRNLLRQANRRGVAVSTVHRAQGSERHTVIFDPVKGDSPFLQTEDARRLINVALSRAQARLVILLSPQDRRHRLLDQIDHLLSGRLQPAGPSRTAPSICGLAQRPDFPACAVGKALSICGVVGLVHEIRDGGARIVLLDAETGAPRVFVTATVLQRCAEAGPVQGARGDSEAMSGAKRTI